MTEHCQLYIKDIMKSLNFSDDTIKDEKIRFKSHLQKMKTNQNPFDADHYAEKEVLNKTISQNIELSKPHWHQSLYMTQTTENDQS